MSANPDSGKTIFLKGLWSENPVFVQVLGICPTLAITNEVSNALAMGLATLFVLVFSNAVVSAIRKLVPKEVRIATFILIIATAVTIADYLVKAISVPVYKALGPFLALIVVNCIILARADAFASRNPVPASIMDGFGMGFGFALGLIFISSVREVLGAGTFLGVPLFGKYFQPMMLFQLPPGGFFSLALWLLIIKLWNDRHTRRGALVQLKKAA
jgi:electron transport complex protein RnfE